VVIDVGALVLAPALVGMAEGAGTVTPSAAHIWAEIDPNVWISLGEQVEFVWRQGVTRAFSSAKCWHWHMKSVNPQAPFFVMPAAAQASVHVLI